VARGPPTFNTDLGVRPIQPWQRLLLHGGARHQLQWWLDAGEQLLESPIEEALKLTQQDNLQVDAAPLIAIQCNSRPFDAQ
jgi:hypothetical protein